MFPVLSRVRMNRQWGGIVDTSPDACPIISKTPVHEPVLQLRLGHRRLQGHAGFRPRVRRQPGQGRNAPAGHSRSRMDRFHTGALIDEHGAAAVAH